MTAPNVVIPWAWLVPSHDRLRSDGGGDPRVREAARACPVAAITVSETVS